MAILIEEYEIVVPGEHLAVGVYEIGDGVIQEGENFYSSLVGVFTPRGDKLRVRALKSRYYPKVGDKVIGIIEDAKLTSWIVDIKGPYSAILLASNAVRGRFDPVRDDTRRIFDVRDVILAEIVSFDRTRDPMLSTNFPRLGKLREGRVIEVAPNYIPRIIGRGGSMIKMLKNETKSKIIVGQNGRIWISGPTRALEEKLIEAVRQITRESHVSGLTDRIEQFLRE